MSDLKKQVNKLKEENVTDPDILEFLFMIADNTISFKNERDIKNEMILSLFDEGVEFNVNRTGTKQIGSTVLQQALWRVMSKVKFLDMTIQKTGGDENVERLVTEGIMTVADRGNLGRVFRDKGGVFMTAFLLGDAFVMFGKGNEDDNPVSFQMLKNHDVYTDEFSDGIRNSRPSTKMVVIQQYQIDDAYDLFPILKEKGIVGRIPGTYAERERRDRHRQTEDELVEIAWSYNRAKRKHIIFAGNTAFEVDRFEDDEYPFIKNKKPYIPVFQFICQPSLDKFYNRGIGDMFYDLAVIAARLLNMEVKHIEENVLPITLVNAPQAKVDELLEKFAMAGQARVNGKLPLVAHEFDANGGQQSVNAQALTTQNLFNEWSAIWDRIYREFSRLGINLDDIERGSGITRGQVIAEEQASNAFVKQMMEYNGSESKELVECTMDAITEFVSNKNKSPLNLKTRMTFKDGSTQKLPSSPTMGMLSKEIKSGNWFVEPDLRTGAIPSDLTKMVQEEGLLALTQDPRKAGIIFDNIAMRRGVDIPPAPPAPPPQPPEGEAPAGGPPQGEVPQIAGQTQRVLPAPTGQALQPV